MTMNKQQTFKPNSQFLKGVKNSPPKGPQGKPYKKNGKAMLSSAMKKLAAC